jgi:hypothetical protein
MPDFVQTEIKAIDDQLRILKDEAARLEAARAALTGGPRRRGRPATNGAARTSARPASRRNGRQAAPRPRRGGNTRANQALELVRERPGITIPEIAKAMKIEPNYLYRVLPRLASDGQAERDGQGVASVVVDLHHRAARRQRSWTQTDPRHQVPAGGLRNSRQEGSENRSIDTGDQRPLHPRRDQGLRARRARGR